MSRAELYDNYILLLSYLFYHFFAVWLVAIDSLGIPRLPPFCAICIANISSTSVSPHRTGVPTTANRQAVVVILGLPRD